MANFWEIATSLDTASARSGIQKTAREAKLQRKELEKQTELLRKSAMSTEQIEAEENAKTKRQTILAVVFGLVFFIGACIAYPIFGIVVGVIIAGIVVFIIIRGKKRKKNLEIRAQAFEEQRMVQQARKSQQKQKTQTKSEKSDMSQDENIRKQLDKLLDLSLQGKITNEEYERKSKILRQRLKNKK